MGLLEVVTLLAALGCGIVAGVFYGFSTFVMKALGALPTTGGVAAMQSVNVAVINPWFLTPFLGTAAACAAMIVVAVLRWSDPRAAYWLAGGVLYLVGTLLVTMACNVPRNDALGAVGPQSAEAATLWADYLSTWTAWNHVRTAAALAATVAFTIALWLRP